MSEARVLAEPPELSPRNEPSSVPSSGGRACPVAMTVNGEALTATVASRTQLAEVIRDHWHYTGTHLGCEQGVCGACTVLVDDVPVRSCISYAAQCDGAVVTTVEGLFGDELGAALREAFSRHHALQCGFCTPGMLVTARDILLRHATLSRARIRHELSGNLCRCTGYVGIVNAVADVADARGLLVEAEAPDSAPPGFASFEAREDSVPDAAGTGSRAGSAKVDADGWTGLARSLRVAAAPDELWDFLVDLRAAAGCIPGIAVTTVDGEQFEASASLGFGPVAVSFAGEGQRQQETEHRRAVIVGNGQSGNGQSQVEVEFRYGVAGIEYNVAELSLGMRFRLRGPLAQYNRPDLVESFVDVLLERFAGNCERSLRGETVVVSDARLGWRDMVATLWRRLKGP